MQKKPSEFIKTMEVNVDPAGCPFREFRDNELGPDLWGLGPAETLRAQFVKQAKGAAADTGVWCDDQVQPLQRSARINLDSWIRAEELAFEKWGAGVVVSKDPTGTDNGKMRSRDVQLIYSDVLQKSSFCRKALASCYMMERIENFFVEHQWDNFTCVAGPDGWLARLHIFSPGMKPGGGAQHRPALSKNGCYLVRLYFVGAWRCVWVSDKVPVNAEGSPLLPFALPSPSAPPPPTKGGKPPPAVPPMVVLWPLLICKALLKLAAPDMMDDKNRDDESMDELDILHCFTGALSLKLPLIEQKRMVETKRLALGDCSPNKSVMYRNGAKFKQKTVYATTYECRSTERDPGNLWAFMQREVATFSWDAKANDTPASGAKGKSPKKPAAKETAIIRRKSVVCVELEETLGVPSYELAGLTPAYGLLLIAQMIRDLPLVKPEDEPEIPQWKTYRWLDWARTHGLYDQYDCPRKRYLKASALLRMSHAPHLLHVTSTESISKVVAKELQKTKKPAAHAPQEKNKSIINFIQGQSSDIGWFDYMRLCEYIKEINVLYLPSMHQNFAAGNAPPVHPPSKNAQAKPGDLKAPSNAPLYLQVDSDEAIKLRISLATMHPRLLANAGHPQTNYIKPAYLFLEKFDWLSGTKEPPAATGYLETRGYDALELNFPPGRHYFRIWVSSSLTWHCTVMSEASLVLCRRTIALCLPVIECPWATKHLSAIGVTFGNWVKMLGISGRNPALAREFYKSYAPDCEWDPKLIGYPRAHLHWMFSRALQELLRYQLAPADYTITCTALQRLFLDPNFGSTEESQQAFPIAKIMEASRCDCSPEENVSERTSEDLLTDEEKQEEFLKAIKGSKSFDMCIQTGEVHCGNLRNKMLDLLVQQKAVLIIQSHWKRLKCQRMLSNIPPPLLDALKMISEQIFATSEGLTCLINQFFKMFPMARTAYTISSGLGGGFELQEHTGAVSITSKDVFVPLFNGTFYCHSPARVHFDVDCVLRHNAMVIFNNDNGSEIPMGMNNHMTYEFDSNTKGYAIHGHAWLSPDTPKPGDEIPWKLTLLTSEEGAFHVCDNRLPSCQEMPLSGARKMDIEEMFIPNRKNILGAVQLYVVKPASVSVRVRSTYAELNLRAVMRESASGDAEESCSGQGELFWRHIGLQARQLTFSSSYLPGMQAFSVQNENGSASSRQLSKQAKKPGSGSSRKSAKAKRPTSPTGPEPRVYDIEVIAPEGWPLTTSQWLRVGEALNPVQLIRPTSARKIKNLDLDDANTKPPVREGDASFRLEVSLTTDGAVVARRHPGRDQAWAAEQESWAERAARHTWGEVVREHFRNKYLVVPETSSSGSSIELVASPSSLDRSKLSQTHVQPSKMAVQSNMKSKSTSIEVEEERYLTKPDHLLDHFFPLPFLEECTKEITERELVTPESAAEATLQLRVRIEAAHARSDELQLHNVERVLGAQQRRNRLLERLHVGGSWRRGLEQALVARDEALQVVIPRNISVKNVKKK